MDSTNHKKSLEERVCELEAQVAELRKMALQNIQSVSDTTQRVTQAEKVQTEPLCPEAKPIEEDSVFTPYTMAPAEETVAEQIRKKELITEQTSKEEYVTEQTTVKETVANTSASEKTEVIKSRFPRHPTKKLRAMSTKYRNINEVTLRTISLLLTFPLSRIVKIPCG